MKNPDFFIVGAPRCGTTAMYNYLKKHPEIFMSVPKEPWYFGTDITCKFRPSLENYLHYFSMAKNEKRVGEASPIYLSSTLAAKEIKEFNPLARIIIMLRNPVDFLHSFHAKNLTLGYENITDCGNALKAEEARKQKKMDLPKKAEMAPACLQYKQMAKFSEQVERYLDVFGKENVFIIIYDDFKENTAKVYRDTLLFLGVYPDFNISFPVYNKNFRLRSKFLSHLHVNDHPSLKHSSSLPARVLVKLFKRINKWNTIAEPRQSMNPDLRNQLQKEFEPEVQRLSKLIGRDLNHWTS